MTSNYDKIVESISALLDEVQRKNESLNKDNSIFILKKANQSLADASKIDNPRSLWKEFWYEGEVCCLFSDSNLGKSIYAVQIANEISKTDKVLYFDFELTEKQFQLRYTSDKDNTLYKFPDNLIRGELDLEKLDPMTFEEDAVNEILKAAINAGCKIVIIDNLTYLCSAMENAEAAGLVMKNLIAIKKQYGFSFLILAHTPKRNLWAKITQNDLAGSKRLYNLFDSVFAIGQSAKDENLRYIKQLKVRWGAKSFGELHVIIARIEKIDNFLQFVETGFAKEIEHLIQNEEEIKEEINKQIMILRKQGKSLREIAKQTDTPKSTVDDIIKRNEKNK